jgi:cephalosporin-C deacetylase
MTPSSPATPRSPMALDSPATPNPARASITVERPDDFDEYWRAALSELADVDATPVYTPRPDMSTPEIDVFDVRYSGTGDVRVAGWYTRPTGETPPTGWPALLLIPGYISDPVVAKSWTLRGYAVFSVAARGKLRAMDPVNPGYPGLLVDDIADPYSYTYRAFYLDTVRAFDLLAALAEIDATRIGVHGSSQGGGLGVVVAALRPGAVACLSAGAPYMCGIMDAVRLTYTYPYQEIREYLTVHPDHFLLVERTTSYVDVLNLAAAVTCPSQIYIGLRDDVCPPETGFALAGALPGEVEFHAYPGAGHDAGLPAVATEIDRFLAQHLRPLGQSSSREADSSRSNA